MPDGVNIDFNALKQPDYLGTYQTGFEVGRQLAAQPPAMGNALRPAAAPDPIADLERLPGPARAVAARHADLLANLGAGLKGYPYEERPRILAHLAPTLAARGVPLPILSAFDPTDANIDEAVASARALYDRLSATPINALDQPAAVGPG